MFELLLYVAWFYRSGPAEFWGTGVSVYSLRSTAARATCARTSARSNCLKESILSRASDASDLVVIENGDCIGFEDARRNTHDNRCGLRHDRHGDEANPTFLTPPTHRPRGSRTRSYCPTSASYVYRLSIHTTPNC